VSRSGVERLTWALLLAGSVALVAASAYRAATFPFTHDESLSFAIFTWEPRWRTTANHHPLNTVLMQACHAVFGDAPLSLRTPNLLALALYLGSVLALLRRVAHPLTRFAGFALLALNPFVLDFFFLARGYGLALAFLMLALALLEPRTAALSAIAAAVAVVANYAFLNAFVPLLAAVLWMVRRNLRVAIPLAVAGAGSLAVLGWQVRALQRGGDLHFGGESGFFSDTLVSLARCSLYSTDVPPAQAVAIGAIVLLAVALLLGCRDGMALFVLLGSVAMAIGNHYVFGARYPIERGALYSVPLYGAALVLALRETKRATLVISGALVLLLSAHFARTFDPRRCYTWQYDAHNADALRIVAADRRGGRQVKLGASWRLEPSLNFYRVTEKYDWLVPIPRSRGIPPGADYVYAFRPDAEKLREQTVVLAWYPDTETVLLRVRR
jgi:hypothetical protein